MIGDRVIVNGRLASPEEARFGLDDVDATYGYGCYETLKVRGGLLYFPEFHEERLLRSAEILGIRHGIRPGDAVAALGRLRDANGIGECNVRILLIGREGRPADWYAFLLPPVVPPSSAYEEGVPCLLFRGERHFPRAKSLSMLLSTVAYRAALGLGCYDALLVDGRGEITEGTRTNLFYVRRGESDAAYTPPEDRVLSGVTRRTLMEALGACGVRTVERPLSVADAVSGRYAFMVTSTSSRVIPVRSLRGAAGPGGPIAPIATPGEGAAAAVEAPLSPEVDRVRAVYDDYLARYSDGAGGLKASAVL